LSEEEKVKEMVEVHGVKGTIKMLQEQKMVTVVDDVCIAMDAEMFKDVFDLMASLIQTEVQVKIQSDGLRVRQMEEAHIALTDMFVPKTYFKTLRAGQKIKELRLPVQDMKSVLTRLSHGDTIELTVIKEGRLHIEIKGRRIRAFNIPLYEAETLEKREPKVPFSVRTKTTMEGLLMAIEDAQKLIIKKGGDSKTSKKNLFGQITMTTMPMGLKVESETEDELYSTETTLTSGWDIMKFDGKVGQQVTVSIPYMIAVVRAISKVTNMMQMEFATNMPMHIIAELPFKDMRLSFWLAPRLKTSAEGVKA